MKVTSPQARPVTQLQQSRFEERPAPAPVPRKNVSTAANQVPVDSFSIGGVLGGVLGSIKDDVGELIRWGLEAAAGGKDNADVDFIRFHLNRLLGPDSRDHIGWLKRDKSAAPVRDVTEKFRATYADAKADENTLPPDADKYVYLTVDGLTGENWPTYFSNSRYGLRRHGLDVREVPVDTEAGVRDNAKVVRKEILRAAAEGKQVVLIGHSKGGLDSTAAIALYPELKQHVRALVAIQSPYAGAPLATDLRSNPLTKWAVKGLAEGLFRGDEASVRDLSYEARKQFVSKYPWPTDIPTVSLATSDMSQTSLLSAPGNYAWLRYGAKTDGLVVDVDAEIPGSNVIRLDDLDHIRSTVKTVPGFSKYAPDDLLETLVSVALTTPPVVQN